MDCKTLLISCFSFLLSGHETISLALLPSPHHNVLLHYRPKAKGPTKHRQKPPKPSQNNPFLFISWLPSILATVESWHGHQGWQYAPFRAVAAPVISGSVWATGRVANTVLEFREWSSPRVQSGKLMEWQAHGEYLGPVPSQHMGGS